MRVDTPHGVLLYCRPCDAVRPHQAEAPLLWCPEGHGQLPLQTMVSNGYDDTFDPAVLMLPRSAWTLGYVQSRYWLQGQYLRRRGS